MQLLQALKPTDYGACADFANYMLLHTDDNFLDRVIFTDESTFHLSGHVNKHNVRIWGSANPHEMVQLHQLLQTH